jgi:hypothetical protein
VVEFLNTVRVSCFSLGGGEFGEDHRLVDDLDGVIHGGQLEHGAFREAASFAAIPLVVLLDQTDPARRSRAAGLGNTPTTSVRRLISLITRSSGFVDQICRQ